MNIFKVYLVTCNVLELEKRRRECEGIRGVWRGAWGGSLNEVVFERDKSKRLLRYVDNRQDQCVARLSASGEASLLMRIISVGKGGVKTVSENCCRCRKQAFTMQSKSLLPSADALLSTGFAPVDRVQACCACPTYVLHFGK